MSEINIERKGNGDGAGNENGGNKKNNNWWIWIIVAILAILIAWMALSDRNEVDQDDTQQEEFTPGMNEETRIEQSN